MLASLVDAPLADPHLVYEPKYDGIRAIVEIAPKGDVHLWSRLGNEKTRQFPEIAAALAQWAHTRKAPLVLDGEIVALDAKGEPTGFQKLQGRIHLASDASDAIAGSAAADSRPSTTAFIAFDLLRDGQIDLRDRPLLERRAALERLFAGQTGSAARGKNRVPIVRISTMVRG